VRPTDPNPNPNPYPGLQDGRNRCWVSWFLSPALTLNPSPNPDPDPNPNPDVRSADYRCKTCGESLGGLTQPADKFAHISKCAKKSIGRERSRNPNHPVGTTPTIAAAFLQARGVCAVRNPNPNPNPSSALPGLLMVSSTHTVAKVRVRVRLELGKETKRPKTRCVRLGSLG